MKPMKFNVRNNPELSRQIQEELFKMGGEWSNGKVVQFKSSPHLYVTDNRIKCNVNLGQLTDGDDYFDNHKNTLTTLEELRSLSGTTEIKDSELCEGCGERFWIKDMRMDVEEGYWNCKKCIEDFESTPTKEYVPTREECEILLRKFKNWWLGNRSTIYDISNKEIDTFLQENFHTEDSIETKESVPPLTDEEITKLRELIK